MTLDFLVSFKVYERVVTQLNELCHAAQAVLDGKATHVDAAGDRYVIDQTLRELETVLTRIRNSA